METLVEVAQEHLQTAKALFEAELDLSLGPIDTVYRTDLVSILPVAASRMWADEQVGRWKVPGYIMMFPFTLAREFTQGRATYAIALPASKKSLVIAAKKDDPASTDNPLFVLYHEIAHIAITRYGCHKGRSFGRAVNLPERLDEAFADLAAEMLLEKQGARWQRYLDPIAEARVCWLRNLAKERECAGVKDITDLVLDIDVRARSGMRPSRY